MILRPPRSTRTDTLFPTRRSSDLESRHKHAIKVWDKREFANLDNKRELGTRNIKVALRRLRRFAREGAANELDIDGTIDGTARQGWLDIRMRPERHNAVKLDRKSTRLNSSH